MLILWWNQLNNESAKVKFYGFITSDSSGMCRETSLSVSFYSIQTDALVLYPI